MDIRATVKPVSDARAWGLGYAVAHLDNSCNRFRLAVLRRGLGQFSKDMRVGIFCVMCVLGQFVCVSICGDWPLIDEPLLTPSAQAMDVYR